MPVICFHEDGHRYEVDGKAVPSVTQILQRAGLVPNYDFVDADTLTKARERGMIVDACCDTYDNPGEIDGKPQELDWSELERQVPHCVPYVRAWADFRQRERFRPIHAQGIVFHAELGYAGTFDGYGLCGSTPTLVERKCTSKIAETYALQTAAYAMPGIGLAVADGDGELLPLVVSRRVVVQLKPDGSYKVAEYTRAEDFEAFRAAVCIAKWKGANGNGSK